MAISQTEFILVEDIQGDMDIRLLSRARAVFSAVIHMSSLNSPCPVPELSFLPAPYRG